MKADLDDFRRLYSSLNDEALLALDRDELVPLAQQCYDAESAERGLIAPAEEEEDPAARRKAHPAKNWSRSPAFKAPPRPALPGRCCGRPRFPVC